MEFEPSPASLQSHFTGEAVSTRSKTQTAVSGARIQLVALTLTDCEILGSLLNWLVLQFSHLYNGNHISTYVKGWL